MSDEHFNVYWWDRDANQHRELAYVSAEQAVNAARRLTHGPASVFGVVERVMITDDGDHTCFLWSRTGGLLWPNKEGKHPDVDA